MSFLTLPVWAAWSLLVAGTAAAVGAFLIPPRRLDHVVASLWPWRSALGETTQPSLWHRIRRAVSLLLTALIAVAMVVALSKPVWQSSGQSQGRLLIVMDSSWSMRARTSSGATRWAHAVEMARAMVDNAAGAEVAIATTADGIVEGPTSDVARLRQTLDRLVPTGGLDGAWPRIADAREVHFLTDGALARVTDTRVIVHSVFTPAANVAVTAFDVEPMLASSDQAQAYVAVANYAPAPQAVRITVTRAADVLVTRTMQIGAGDTYRDVIPVASAGDARFRVHISAEDNALDIDDDAVSWLWAAQPIRVGVVGAESLLPRLLAEDSTLRVFRVDPSAYATAAADVWVFDEWLPPVAPSAPALLIEPPPSPWAGTLGLPETNPRWRSGARHEILDGVDAEFVRLRKAVSLQRPNLRSIAVSDTGTPLVSVEESASGRYVVLGFSTADSNIASTSAYPILIGNAIDWLARPERGVRRQMGPAALPATTSRVTSPTGETLPIVRFGGHVTANFQTPGLYLVDAAGTSRVMTVALDDPLRSNLLVSSLEPAQSDAPRPSAAALPWWIVAAWTAFVLVAVEWLTWLRRVTV